MRSKISVFTFLDVSLVLHVIAVFLCTYVVMKRKIYSVAQL